MVETPTLHTIDDVLQHQRAWAVRNAVALSPDGLSFAKVSSGIFVDELSSQTLTELALGAGSELDRIQSLRSSSCLALNVFEPWRSNSRPLSRLFGKPVDVLEFEKTQPTGLRGVAPHLDVFLTGPSSTVGVESKFLEMYSPIENHFANSYFESSDLWEGLSGCRTLAFQIASGEQSFRWLHAAQLLKHALGMRRNQTNEIRLVLLWYRLEGLISPEIENEIGRFTRAVSDDIDFTAMTYQEFVSRLQSLDEPMPGYLDYLDQRYRLDGSWRRDLPLLDLANRPYMNHRTGLDSTISAVDVEELTDAYLRSVANAPQRPLRYKDFLVGHDGGGGFTSAAQEKVVAKALFNLETPLPIGDHTVTLVDYEVPLRAERTDGGIGEIDLLGVDELSRPWIIELKVHPNTETPLKALMQALRYSAILDANKGAILSELRHATGLDQLSSAPVLAVAADRAWWDRLRSTSKAGSWLASITALGEQIDEALGLQMLLVDLGDLKVEVSNGRATVVSNLEPEVLDPRLT